jgi:hypothetical protein
MALAALMAVASSPAPVLTVDVIPDLSTFSFVDVGGDGDATPGDPFIVEGDVLEVGTETVIGHYLCRGYFIVPQADGDVTTVHQSFEIDGEGTIHVEGNESDVSTVRAIVGASGGFSVRNNAVLIADPMPDLGPLAFRATFAGVN